LRRRRGRSNRCGHRDATMHRRLQPGIRPGDPSRGTYRHQHGDAGRGGPQQSGHPGVPRPGRHGERGRAAQGTCSPRANLRGSRNSRRSARPLRLPARIRRSAPR
jgi:hypothetical protein